MKSRIRVGVIFGGRSAEHEVSLASARSIMRVLDPEKYEIVPLGIDHAGRWLTTEDPMATLSSAAEGTPSAELTSPTPSATGRELVPGATGKALPPLDVVFPVLHGPFGEDGTIQGLFELADLPYVGCGVLASALAMDKTVSKEIFAARGLPVVAGQTVKRKAWEMDPNAILAKLEATLRYPMFVKPANLGSSVGISKAGDRNQLQKALTNAARYDRKLLVEEAVPNAREIECSVLGNDDPVASVPGEIIPCNEFYDYAAKYVDGQSQLIIPASIPAEVSSQVQELAVQAFLAIDGAGLARVDFLMDGLTGKLFLNEVNTMPGFTKISMYPKLWEASGISYAELINRLIELALERHADRARSLATYSGAIPPAQP